jgi:hypothetical protein
MHVLAVSRRFFVMIALAFVASACTDTNSTTNLNPEGPPMLRQVRLNHRVFDANDPLINFPRRVFAFGTHDLAAADEVQPNVTSAIVLGNSMRLIIDELLVGNNLEEIACRAAVDDDNFQRVPLGANPDDIARCSAADDVLPASCPGSNPTSVCICQNDAGCPRGEVIVPKGESVGVLDVNQDGGVDDTRFIDGAVGIRCGDIDVPIDLDGSYWNPSGDQNRPATGGFEALGPAIVLTALGPMPTNLPCLLTVADDVVDKDRNRLCAPVGGDVTKPCTPGDMSAFTFRTEALAFNSASWTNGETGVSRTDPAIFVTNTPLDPDNIDNITVNPPATFTVRIADARQQLIEVSWTDPLDAETVYEVTLTPGITDTFNQGLPAPQVFTFTTGQN